jgi:hypothetical protein
MIGVVPLAAMTYGLGFFSGLASLALLSIGTTLTFGYFCVYWGPVWKLVYSVFENMHLSSSTRSAGYMMVSQGVMWVLLPTIGYTTHTRYALHTINAVMWTFVALRWTKKQWYCFMIVLYTLLIITQLPAHLGILFARFQPTIGDGFLASLGGASDSFHWDDFHKAILQGHTEWNFYFGLCNVVLPCWTAIQELTIYFCLSLNHLTISTDDYVEDDPIPVEEQTIHRGFRARNHRGQNIYDALVSHEKWRVGIHVYVLISRVLWMMWFGKATTISSHYEKV